MGKDVGRPKQPGGWLRSSHPLKKAEQLTRLMKSFRTEDVTGLKPYTETVDTLLSVVAERSVSR